MPLRVVIAFSLAHNPIVNHNAVVRPISKGGNVAKDIRELRELAGLSQYRLAAATGIERTRLSLFENNHIAPSVTEQAAIEKALLEEIGRRSAQLLNALSA